MQDNTQEEIEFETNFELKKDLKRQERMSSSESARSRRKDIKNVREQLLQNEYAAARRAKKKR